MKTLVITPGDPESIGPEVTAKALYQLRSKLKQYSVLIFGSKKPYEKFKTQPFAKHILNSKNIHFVDMPEGDDPGFQAGWAIEHATQTVLASPNESALITGPIHKGRLRDGGYPYNGHTDFLGDLCDSPNPTMMLTNSHLKVSLVTAHCSLKNVSELLTVDGLLKTIKDTVHFLQKIVKVKKPKIAVLGINPHSGENGVLGDEEMQVINPAIESARAQFKSVVFSGPHPADSFFGGELSQKKALRHDAIIAIYHDQGLIPVKLLGPHESVNITLGLPIIRTSVDHGTAFNIAGKNKANPQSMVNAIEAAMKLLKGKV